MPNTKDMANTTPEDQTKPIIIDLLRQQLSTRQVADELNYRKLYMVSGASWNAGRVDTFLNKHQISKPSYQ